MKNHIAAVREFMTKAGQTPPDTLTIPDEKTRILRAKLAVEECLELCSALGVTVYTKVEDVWRVDLDDMDILQFGITHDANPVEVLDAAVDSLWVSTTGAAAAFGLLDKLEEAITEVDRSNLSKFIDGHRDPVSGKWIKGPSYSPANIGAIVNG